MRVLRIVSELDFGGVEQVVALSVPALAKIEGVKIKVLVLGNGGRISEMLSQKGLDVLILNKKTNIPNFRLVLELKSFFEKEQVDIIHTQGAEANFHGLWAAELAGVRIKIGEEIGLPNHHTYWKWIFKWVYKKANHVIAISEAVANKITALGEVPRKKVTVIYNPSSIKAANGKSDLSLPEIIADEKSFVFVTTCRLVPIKNLGRLIHCLGELIKSYPQTDFALWLIGDGAEKETLMELTNQLQLSNSVRFLGFRESVQEFLMAADVFILPSLSEGSSVSLAEAMMAGLPSIVTEVGGAKEILGNSRSSILVNPNSTDSILSAMQSVFDLTENERKEMGKRAKIESRRFSIDVYVRDLLALYRQ